MANTLDPPIERVPEEFLKNHDTRIYFDELQRWRHDVYVKLGEGGDPVSDSEEFSIEDTSTNSELLEEFETEFSQLTIPTLKEIQVISTSTDFTTTGSQVIICTNTAPIDITLNLTPDDGEQLHIKRQNVGRVNVIGVVDGDTRKAIVLRYDSPHLIYTVDAGEWSII